MPLTWVEIEVFCKNKSKRDTSPLKKSIRIKPIFSRSSVSKTEILIKLRKMMTKIFYLLPLTIIWAIKSGNPLKTRVSILGARIIIFTYIQWVSRGVWIPTLMILLFIGGIIIIFIILSSIIPNEKSIKSKGASFILFLTTLFILVGPQRASKEAMPIEAKNFLIRGENFWVMTLIILIFFLASMRILSSEQTPMRTLA